MSNIFHRDYTIDDGIHHPISEEYADEAARLAATGFKGTAFSALDVNKFVRQLDTNYIYMLVNYSPITWCPVTSLGNDPNAIHSDGVGEIAAITEKIVPVDGDWLISEDSEAGNSKKKIQIGNIAASCDKKVKVSANDTTADYLDAKIIVSDESNSANILEVKEVGDGGDENLKIAIDETKIDHNKLDNTHNLTNDIDHDSITNTHNLTNDIDHTTILNKGINTHDQIDTHINSINNPHATDIENLGTGTLAELNDAITDATLDDSSDSRPPTGVAGGDLNGTYPNPGVDDGADGSAIHDNIAGEIVAIAEKVAPVASDLVIINDTEDSNNPKSVQFGNIPNIHSHANKAELDLLTDGNHDIRTDNPHSTDIENLGSGTLAELNDAISDATLDDSSDSRPPDSHAASHGNGGGDEINVAGLSGVLADSQTPAAHDLGGAEHSADTLSNLNLKISDATLLDSGDIQYKTGSLHAAADHQNGGSLEISLAGLSGEVADAQKTAISKNSGAIVGTRKELNLIEGENINLTIADDAGNDEVDITIKSFPEYNFLAESFENPDNATWAVNSLANIWKPASDPTILVRAFDDTTEEGIGFTRLIPLGVTNIIFYFISYASTAPGTAKVITPKLYTRIYADNSAVGSWSAGLDLTSIDIPTNAYPQYDTQTIALSTLSLTAGEMVKFELTRKTIGVTSNLVGDWWLHYLRISFS